MQKLVQPDKAFALLKKYAIPFANWKIAKNQKLAAKAAKEIGFPVAMKLVSKSVSHKSDIGGVKVNISCEAEAIAAFDDIMHSAKKAGLKAEGVLVQKMEQGTEVIVGLKRDMQFGPVVLFGLGGIFVEVFRDVSMRIAPLTKEDCLGMIEGIRGYEILKGARGRKQADIEGLVKILIAVSKIGEKNKSIAEIDLNPVIVDDKSARVVDVRILSEK